MILTVFLLALYLVSVVVCIPSIHRMNHKRITVKWDATEPTIGDGEAFAAALYPGANVGYLIWQSIDYARNKERYDLRAQQYRLRQKDRLDDIREEVERDKAKRIAKLEAAADKAYKELQSVRGS